MKSDYQEWAEFSQQVSLVLARKILGVKPTLQLIIKANGEKETRLDLIKQPNGCFRLEMLEWDKNRDRERMNDPLEKIKLLGRFSPSLFHTSIEISKEKSTIISYLIEHLLCQKHEYKVPKKEASAAKARYTLKLNHNRKKITTTWNVYPKRWNIIPELFDMLESA